MKEELVSFEVAKLANEKGFNIETSHFYNEEDKDSIIYQQEGCEWTLISSVPRDWNSTTLPHYSAPTQSLLQKWLREEHKIHINVFMGDGDGYKCVVQWHTPTYNGFETYEQALEAGLKKALEKL